jgi:hypothetical protein
VWCAVAAADAPQVGASALLDSSTGDAEPCPHLRCDIHQVICRLRSHYLSGCHSTAGPASSAYQSGICRPRQCACQYLRCSLTVLGLLSALLSALPNVSLASLSTTSLTASPANNGARAPELTPMTDPSPQQSGMMRRLLGTGAGGCAVAGLNVAARTCSNGWKVAAACSGSSCISAATGAGGVPSLAWAMAARWNTEATGR